MKAVASNAQLSHGALKVRTEREFRCDECGRRCTVGMDGETEYGHSRGLEHGDQDRCSRRPDSVDPDKFGGNPAWGDSDAE